MVLSAAHQLTSVNVSRILKGLLTSIYIMQTWEIL